MSSGKPVVATKLPELLPYADYLYLAGTKEEFLEEIETALQEKDESLTRKRIELAGKNDWEARFTQISGYVRSLYPPASVIVVTYNNLEYTRLCLESLFAKTAYPNYELIVVDNGSTDGTKEYLSELGRSRLDVKIILNDRNLGFSGANNLGIRAAKGDFLVFLNNDTVLTRGLIGGLVRYLKNPKSGWWDLLQQHF